MSDDSHEHRSEFLLEMYKQTSSHLNRHILITWQSVGVIAGTLAVFGVADRSNVTGDTRLDFVTGIVTVLCAWAIAHIFDASNWFNRNLHIITNIERQFLFPTDAEDIHFYFVGHRKNRSEKVLVRHFEIHAAMVVALWLLIIGFHFYTRVLPGLGLSLENFSFTRAIPYIVTLIAFKYCAHVISKSRADDEELHRKSPGKTIVTAAPDSAR